MTEHRAQSCEERFGDDLAAYALGALDEGSVDALERHLAECPACAERLRWLQPAVDLVPASVPQLEPPARLRERLSAIAREEAAAERIERESPPGPARRRWPRLRWPAMARPALAALAAAAVLLAGAGGYLLGSGRNGSSVQTFTVRPVSPKFAASGTIEVDDGEGTIQLKNLPPLPGDRVYQVWTAHDSEIRPSSVFVARRGGQAATAIPDLPSDTDRVLITREPAGGSQVATTAPVLEASLG